MAVGKLHLVVIDGNELTRALLKYVVHASSAVEVVGEAADYESAVAALQCAVPDAIVIGDDLPYEEKSAVLSVMHSEYPEVRIIELSVLERALLRKKSGFAQNGLERSVLNALIADSSGSM